jgi:hypothetical protein
MTSYSKNVISSSSPSPFPQLFRDGHLCPKPPLVTIFYIPYAHTNSLHIILNRIQSSLLWFSSSFFPFNVQFHNHSFWFYFLLPHHMLKIIQKKESKIMLFLFESNDIPIIFSSVWQSYQNSVNCKIYKIK